MGDHIACQFPEEGVSALVEAGVDSALDLGDTDRGAFAEPSACSAACCGVSSCCSLSDEGD
jgi:hypothetical protein